MAKKQKLELTWIGKDEEVKLEPRVLVEDTELSYGDKDTENMIIHGDNLLALKALEQDYTGKVKCIYIDPPYNTGYAFEHYDDGLEHSIWLNLMKKRLEILKKLLAPEGVIVVQIGDDEMAYLKVLMDEIFYRERCIGQVAVRMSHSAGMKRKAMEKRLIKNTEYLLVYYNEIPPVLSPLYEESLEYPVNYYQYIDKFSTETEKGTYIKLIDVLWEKFEDLFNKYDLKKNNKSIAPLYSLEDSIQSFILENKERIVRKDSNVPSVNNLDLDFEDDQFITYKSSDNQEYFIGINSAGNYYQIYSLEDKVKQIESIDLEGNVFLKDSITNLLGDWWDNYYKDMSRVDIEGGVKMKTSKKPERLIYNIFKLITKENDIILDSFLGSGTTAAVAHKMNRRYISIELGDHAKTLSVPRLKKVIDGIDKSGITQITNWKGGGGFKFYTLAPSLLTKDKFGNWVIEPSYDATLLASAMAKQEGFKYYPNENLFWKQGYSTETDYIFTTTQFVTTDLIDKIHDEMKEDETLLVCAKSFHKACESAYPNITIKKIPQVLLGKCEFGKDDYSLNILENNDVEISEGEDE